MSMEVGGSKLPADCTPGSVIGVPNGATAKLAAFPKEIAMPLVLLGVDTNRFDVNGVEPAVVDESDLSLACNLRFAFPASCDVSSFLLNDQFEFGCVTTRYFNLASNRTYLFWPRTRRGWKTHACCNLRHLSQL